MKNSLVVLMLLLSHSAFADNSQSKTIECEYNTGDDGMGGVPVKMTVISSQLQQGSLSLDTNSSGDKKQNFTISLSTLGSGNATVLTITTELNGVQLSNSGASSANLSLRGGSFENFTVICRL